MTGRYYYEDQEATTKREHGTWKWGGERKQHQNKLRRFRDFGFILTTIMTLRSTIYSCGPQLNTAASTSHDTDFYENLTPAKLHRSRRLWLNPTRNITRGVLDLAYQHLTGLSISTDHCVFHDILFNLQMISSTPEFDTPFSTHKHVNGDKVSDRVLLMPSFSAIMARE